MTAPTSTRPPDVVGSLEVRRSHTGRWLICLADGTPIYELAQPRKRNAVALRALLLTAMPDWTAVVGPDASLPDSADRDAICRVTTMARLVAARRIRNVCLGCGCREYACACGTDRHPGRPALHPGRAGVDAMTAPTWPAVHICRCGRLQQEHIYRPATRTLPARWAGTDDAVCAGYTQARVEERPPASELQRRLDAVLALTLPDCPPGLTEDQHPMWALGYAHALVIAKQAARGET